MTGAGDDRAHESSTGSATSVALGDDVREDLTLDFGFVPPMVSVGDFVWFDADHDGVQDEDEKGIGGVVLTIVGPDGGPVTDVSGGIVGPVTTAADGTYLFERLPVLPEGQGYTVRLDASTLPDGTVPTRANVGDDRAVDSSTGEATSWLPLTSDGAKDRTLDFGFWMQPVPTPEPEPTPTPEPDPDAGAVADLDACACAEGPGGQCWHAERSARRYRCPERAAAPGSGAVGPGWGAVLVTRRREQV